MLGFCLLASAACGSDAPVATIDYAQPIPSGCHQDHTRLLQLNRTPGLQTVLVPGEPTSLVLCGNDTRAVIEGTDQVLPFVDRLNGLRPYSSDALKACPLGGTDVPALFFNYPDGDVSLVVLDVGCDLASNGHVFAQVDKATMDMIGSPLRLDTAG